MQALRKIKNILLPTKHNLHHPHVLRLPGLSVVIVLLLVIQVAYNVTTAHQVKVLAYATNVSVAELITLTNKERSKAGLSALKQSSALNKAAAAKAADMFAKNYWDHVSPTGTEPWYFITKAGYSYTTAGENLAHGFSTSSGVMNGWMGSGGHRANILNSGFKDIGIAVANGTLQGEPTTLVVAMYATPAVLSSPAPNNAGPQNSAPASNSIKSSPKKPAKKPAAKPAPKPTAEPTEQPVVLAETNQHLAPLTQTIGQFNPLTLRLTTGWGKFATLGVISVVLTSSLMHHRVLRKYKTKRQRIRKSSVHPLAIASASVIVIITLIVTSYGAIL